ncbi:MAG TPA: DUF2461 domain-containing protein [Baekduia sp.]|uniref:DUF2461 domain-containing protein n=1 Tax=Baekduia sp. TaxID=2600305 RepID=UPI002B6EE54B|nr:DUF2461 domain-containing protein [Baekduia sp.]HMJ36528.1 DUF2461 domain-containing protein [Baekduia sp.]
MPEPQRFTGFPPEAFAWFAGLRDDNSKSYFTAQRTTYDAAVRGALEAMLEALAAELGGGGAVKVFRQQRDTRFSADKSPYKTRTYGLISDRPGTLAGLYAEVSEDGLFAGTGYYALAPDQLGRFRAAVADEATGPELERAIATARDAGVALFGEALKTAPRGYPRDHPRVALLRHKSLVAGGRRAPDAGGIPRDTALAHARAVWDACGPLNAWLDAHVGASDAPPPPSRYGARRAR